MAVAKDRVIPAPTAPLTEGALDEILALQFLVAWAGEGRCKPRRLGWWDTDLVDPDGGGDLLARLAPRTHAWAALEAIRETARQTDTKARERHGEPDRLRTIFFLGFEAHEKLSDRLAAHCGLAFRRPRRCRCHSPSPVSGPRKRPSRRSLPAGRRPSVRFHPSAASSKAHRPPAPTIWSASSSLRWFRQVSLPA